MKIVEVAPFIKGSRKRHLSYFTSLAVQEGALVTVSVRNKKILGVALAVKDAAAEKIDVKSSEFGFRKIDAVHKAQLYLPSFIEACNKTADHFACEIGSVIDALSPSQILNAVEEIADRLPAAAPQPKRTEEDAATRHSCERYIFQAPDQDRYAQHRSLVREAFARKKSVFLCVPTALDAIKLHETLKKGIEQQVFFFHSSLSKKQVITQWIDALACQKPVVIIGTSSFISIPRADIGTYVVENEMAGAYRMQSRPYIDIRTALEFIAKYSDAKIVICGSLLRVSTLWRFYNHELLELSPPHLRSLSTAQNHLIKMNEENPAGKKKEFKIISPELEQIIKNARKTGDRVFLYNSRRGLAPITTCRDCGHVVMCKQCGAPVSLHQQKMGGEEVRIFICHRCGERRDAMERCVHCTSWDLKPLGIGIETIEEEIRKITSDTPLFMVSSDHTPKRKDVEKVVDEFYATGGAIMIGTEMAIPYLQQPVEHGAVVSLDALFGLPDFLIHERIMNILLSIRRMSSKTCLIQTRVADTSLFEWALQGDLINFYRFEIKEREEYQYPPFTLFIKISIAGAKTVISKEMQRIKELIDDETSGTELSIFPAFIPAEKGKHVLNGLIRIPRTRWIDQALLEKLRSLPVYVKVVVDTETIL